MGRFPFDVKFQFELPENSMNVGKGQLFPEFPEKMTLRSIPNSFWENSHREFQFHLIFPRRIFRFSVEWFVFNNFRIFWKLFRESSATFIAVDWLAPLDTRVSFLRLVSETCTCSKL